MGQPQVNQQMVQQVVALLQQGISPEELAQQGVPVEVIQMAIQMLQQQPQAPVDDPNLAVRHIQ